MWFVTYEMHLCCISLRSLFANMLASCAEGYKHDCRHSMPAMLRRQALLTSFHPFWGMLRPGHCASGFWHTLKNPQIVSAVLPCGIARSHNYFVALNPNQPNTRVAKQGTLVNVENTLWFYLCCSFFWLPDRLWCDGLCSMLLELFCVKVHIG